MIAADHTDQCDAVYIVALGNHLRAYKQVNFACVQPCKQALKIVAPAYRVAIHASDPRCGEDFAKPLLTLLRTCAEVIEVLTVALGASPRNSFAHSAVMAFKPLSLTRNLRTIHCFVVGKRDGAVVALQFDTASSAEDCKRIAAAVEQDQHLLAAIEGRFGLLNERT